MTAAASRSSWRVWRPVFLVVAAVLLVAQRSGSAASLTLTSIAIDGVTPDWGQVLLNSAQTSRDGDGRTVRPCSLSSDRDCPITIGNGNDLLTFSWTYDSNFLYLYLDRYQAASTGVDFFLAADVDGDRRFDSTSGDKLIHLSWNGGSGNVLVELCPYLPQPYFGQTSSTAYAVGTRAQPSPANGYWYVATTSGVSGASPPAWCTTPNCTVADGTIIWKLEGPANTDPLANPLTGYVDGYKLAGTSSTSCTLLSAGGTTYPTPGTNASWCAGNATCALGRADGLAMEARIRWDAFGAAMAPSPFYWHVSSANSNRVESSVDNVGGPTGGIGTLLFRSATLTPNNTAAVSSPGSTTYSHTLTNTGNTPDTFELSATSSLGARIDLFDGTTLVATDPIGSGAWSAVTAGYDTDADGRPDFTLPSGASKALSVRITMPSLRSGTDSTQITATSANDPSAVAKAIDVSVVGVAALTPLSLSEGTVAGVGAPFALPSGITLTNFTGAADTLDFTATEGAGCTWPIDLLADNGGAPGSVIASSSTGNGQWDFVSSSYDSNSNGKPDFGPLAANASQKLWLRLTPPSGTSNGASCSATLTAQSPITGASASASYSLTVGPAVSFKPDYTVAAQTNKPLITGGSVLFGATIQNNESVARAYSLSASETANPTRTGLIPPAFLSDPDGDGNPTDGCLIAPSGGCMSQTPLIGPFGGQYHVAIQVFGSDSGGPIPVSTTLSSTATATATVGGASGSQLSEAVVGYLSSFSDPLDVQSGRFFSPCQTVYIHAAGLVPSDVNHYALIWRDGSGATVRTVSPWATTARGFADDALALPASASGAWTATLTDSGSSVPPRTDAITFTVERGGHFTALATDKPIYSIGDSLSITAAARNDNAGASLDGTSFVYVVEDLAGTQYSNLAGAFGPLPGTTRSVSNTSVPAASALTDGFTIGSVNYPTPGHYSVAAQWRLSCGSTPLIDTLSTPFDVAAPAPVITSPPGGGTVASANVAGTGFSGASVTLKLAGNTYGPVPVTNGSWSIPIAPPLATGTYVATATESIGGMTSVPSASVTFNVDATPPVITSPKTGLVTNSSNLLIAGTSGGNAVAAVAQLFDDNTLLQSTPYVGGTFTFTETRPPRLAKSPPDHRYRVRSLDASGNATDFSTPVVVTSGIGIAGHIQLKGGGITGKGCACAAEPEGLIAYALPMVLLALRRRRRRTGREGAPKG